MSQENIFENGTTCGANLSPCRDYRYSLWREWDSQKETCVFIGLNPSTADESEDDPTIRRCIGFAKKWGFGRLMMINLFALRATDPEVMMAGKSPVGRDNDQHLLAECASAGLVVAAWGNSGKHLDRNKAVTTLLSDVPMKCFKLTAKEQPAHPLYQRSDAELIKFNE